MKDIKCPLCGKELRLKWSPSTHYHVGCGYCGWETSKDRGAPEMAWKDAEEFISKFPPIMRVEAGDHVEVCHERELYAVLYTDADRGTLYLQNCRGIGYSFDVSEIRKWPWELKQEGGSND